MIRPSSAPPVYTREGPRDRRDRRLAQRSGSPSPPRSRAPKAGEGLRRALPRSEGPFASLQSPRAAARSLDLRERASPLNRTRGRSRVNEADRATSRPRGSCSARSPHVAAIRAQTDADIARRDSAGPVAWTSRRWAIRRPVPAPLPCQPPRELSTRGPGGARLGLSASVQAREARSRASHQRCPPPAVPSEPCAKALSAVRPLRGARSRGPGLASSFVHRTIPHGAVLPVVACS